MADRIHSIYSTSYQLWLAGCQLLQRSIIIHESNELPNERAGENKSMYGHRLSRVASSVCPSISSSSGRIGNRSSKEIQKKQLPKYTAKSSLYQLIYLVVNYFVEFLQLNEKLRSYIGATICFQ